jgi:hypothetical protein
MERHVVTCADAIAAVRAARPKVRKPEGRCYKLSWRTLINMSDPGDWLLVHGEGNGPPGIGRTGHAWLEHGNTIFDAVDGSVMDWVVYERRYGLVACIRYTRLEAAQKACETAQTNLLQGGSDHA